MGLVKKASKLLKGVHRHKDERRSPPYSTEKTLHARSTGRIGRFVGGQKLQRHRSTLETSKDNPPEHITEAVMAQEVAHMHGHNTHQMENSRKPRTMADTPRIQISEDDEEKDQVEVDNEFESEDEVDESVIEEMHKLEESFRGISRRYRLINRIGEGDSDSVPGSGSQQPV